MLSKNQIKYLHSLRLGKFRDLNRAFLAEGIKLVDDLVNSHFNIHAIYGTQKWMDAHRQLITGIDTVFQEVAEDELKKVSNLVSPNEVLAVVAYPETVSTAPTRLGNIILLLDRIQDPGNLGTIIRTADWFGISDIFCSEDTADLYNPKVVQATMGSIFRVSVHYVGLGDFIAGLEGKWTIYGASAEGKNIYQIEPKFPAAVMIGNESKGISRGLIPMITKMVGIPAVSKGAESLNASVAAGIVISEFCRRKVVGR